MGTSSVPYHCIVVIGRTQYGRGTGTSKKIAKRQAGTIRDHNDIIQYGCGLYNMGVVL